jgi:NADH dehydrogenase FAD-containing subunit
LDGAPAGDNQAILVPQAVDEDPALTLRSYSMPDKLPVVVIVGAGFGGLAAAKALKDAPVRVVVIDRSNHHLFQPLLYQVATSILSPGQIASPIRGLLRKHANTTVILGEVTGVDPEKKCVFVDGGGRPNVSVEFDYLILATGASHSYFGHDEYERFAPGLKTLADAVAIRNRILGAFELAEADPTKRSELLTFVLVGAGPTGVEMASAIAVLARQTLNSEFRRIDPKTARIVLIDVAPRILGNFAESLSAASQARLETLGVEVRLGHGVEDIDDRGVLVGSERIPSKNIFWTAGVKPSPAGEWLKVSTDRAGRVKVQPDLAISGQSNIFAIGDTVYLEHNGKPLPGVAQVAMQQGAYVAKVIHLREMGEAPPPPFRYFDKGNMAVVGKGFAIVESGRIRLSGYLAWLAWAGIHLRFLARNSMRMSVFVQWAWTYLTGQRGSGLIVNHHGAEQAILCEVPQNSSSGEKSG